MTPADFLAGLSYPLRSGAVLAALSTFFLLSLIVVFAYSSVGVFALGALWLGLVIVVAVIRYLVLLAEARSEGAELAPPGPEYFTLTDKVWTLFPAVVFLCVASLVDALVSDGRPLAARIAIGIAALLYPATIGVLTLTRSPLESVNPLSIGRFIRRVGSSYGYAVLAAALPGAVVLLASALPDWLTVLLMIVSLASFFSVVGTLSRTSGIVREVGIPLPEEPGETAIAADLEKRRTAALGHAYGFASRGNRDGALAHIRDALASDPDPDTAWRWYFEGMQTWQDDRPALVFAQLMLHRLLDDGATVPAVKLLLRCRLLNPRFKPLPEDLERAVSAALECSNDELAESLKRL